MLLSLILLLNSVFANPEIQTKSFVDANIKVGMQMSGLHYWESSGGLFSHGKNGVDKIGPFVVYAYKSNGRYYENKDLEYNLIGNAALKKSTDDIDTERKKALEAYVKAIEEQQKCTSCIKKEIPKPQGNMFEKMFDQFYKKLRTSHLNINFKETGKSTIVTASFKDSQLHAKYQIGGGGDRWDIESSNDQIKGTIRVGYHLPPNTWAVVIQRTKRQGVFNVPYVDAGFKNSFNSNLPLRGDEKYIVWGKPDTDVYQEFLFDNYSQGANVEGDFEVSITPIDFSKIQSKSLADITKSISEIKPYSSAVNFETHLNNITNLLYLISRPDLREGAMNILTTNQIVGMINGLSGIAYSYEAQAQMWDLKAASTILSHEFALLFLKQISVFCKDEKIVLPYSKTEAQVLGLKLANFFLEKSKMRLEYEHFKHYETLLKLLSSYNGKTFAQVRKNETEALRIKKAYDILINTVNMRLSAFKAAHDEIKFIYDKFGSLGAPGSENAMIFELMKSLNGADAEFNSDLLGFLRQFQMDNNSTISTRSLISKLNSIKASQKEVVAQINSKVKIAGFTPTSGGGSFIQSVQEMTIHNAEILSETLEGSFENFRKSYFDPSKVNPVLSQIQGCVR